MKRYITIIIIIIIIINFVTARAQELCESLGGRPGLSVLMSLTVSVDVKHHVYLLTYWCLTSTETIMLIRHGEKGGGGMEVGEE